MYFKDLIKLGRSYSRSKSKIKLIVYILASKFDDYDGLLQTINSLHDSLFFYNSFYYEIDNRLLGIKYINTFPSKDGSFNYKPIFWIILASHLVKLLKHSYSVYKEFKRRSKQILEVDPTIEAGEGRKESECKICYDQRQNTTATPCGHLFCWKCILKYTLYKEECPICRSATKPKDIFRLINID